MTYSGFQNVQELERQRLITVELPNLINRILHISMIPYPIEKEDVEMSIKDIIKITNAECKSALEYLKEIS